MKILVVDDEADIESLFVQRFRKEIRGGQLTFVFATSGEQALEVLKTHESEFVLILSDINMPGMSGFQLLRKLKEKNPNPPPKVLLITAYGDNETRMEAQKLGADGFLNKPIDFTALKERLLLQ
jgi:two-component system, chemotaxis family, chemotaxis protein CheY